jgi:hypothetical protein
MSHFTNRVTRTAGLALAVGAIAAPGAFAMPVDGPGTNEAAAAAPRAIDARSPDAKDYNEAVALATKVDARTPDTQDFAAGRNPGDQVAPTIAASDSKVVDVDTSPGLSADDVLITGGAAGLVLLAGAGAVVATRRRRASEVA